MINGNEMPNMKPTNNPKKILSIVVENVYSPPHGVRIINGL
jgi:hypothetical protein